MMYLGGVIINDSLISKRIFDYSKEVIYSRRCWQYNMS